MSFIGRFVLPLPENLSLKLNHFGFAIENEMFWLGLKSDWEQKSLKIWIELAKGADVIFDIGANTGIYSLLAKKFNPTSKIYAFEPQPNIYNCLSKQIKLNDFDIQAFPIALSNENGKAHFYNYWYDTFQSNTTVGSLNPEFTQGSTQQSIEVETIRLEDFLKRQEVGKIDLMKIDVETFEPQVFEGAGDQIKALEPIILIEILTEEIGAKVEKLLSPMPFDIYHIDENKGLTRVENMKEHHFKNHLIIPLSKKDRFATALAAVTK